MPRFSTTSWAEVCAPLQKAADHFNEKLLESVLPQHVVTFQRTLRTAALLLPDRWQDVSGQRVHEIALDPGRLGNSRLIDPLTILFRQQVHLWQLIYGTPSRGGYHNREWSRRMTELGFSVLGSSGKGETGQRVEVLPVRKGKFLKACESLVATGFAIDWIDRGYDSRLQDSAPSLANLGLSRALSAHLSTRLSARFSDLESIADPRTRSAKRKVKYGCRNCESSVWGRSGLKLICGGCKKMYVEH